PRRQQRLAPIPVVMTPPGGDLEGLRAQPNAEGHPERRGEHRLGGRRRALDGAVLDRPAAALGEFIELLGGEFLSFGGEHPDEVAVAHARLVDLLLGTGDRPEEILEDHPLELVADLRRRRDALEEVAHVRISTLIWVHLRKATVFVTTLNHRATEARRKQKS